jgi:hypothetical protein
MESDGTIGTAKPATPRARALRSADSSISMTFHGEVHSSTPCHRRLALGSGLQYHAKAGLAAHHVLVGGLRLFERENFIHRRY